MKWSTTIWGQDIMRFFRTAILSIHRQTRGLISSLALQLLCDKTNGYAHTDSYRNQVEHARPGVKLTHKGADYRRGNDDGEDSERQLPISHCHLTCPPADP